MPIVWLIPAALAGLGLIGLPIAIHLLVRQQSRQVAFPSLRFLQRSNLSAFRRRSVQDALLLAVRVSIVAIAAAALAAPVFVTTSRQASYARRVARAVVIDRGLDPVVAATHIETAFASSVFSRAPIGQAILEATHWLDQQPPAAREIVIVSAFRLGQLSDADLIAVPETTGITLVRIDAAPVPTEVAWPALRRQGNSLQRVERQLRLEPEQTTSTEGGAVPIDAEPIAIVAAPADQRLADAALNAALTAGVHWPPDAPTRLMIAWRGADERAIAQAAAGGPVVRMEVPSPQLSAASAVARAIAGAVGDRTHAVEPVRLSADQLARWQRPSGAPAVIAAPVDEGDRRWFWGAALALLALEQVWRRRVRAARVGLVESPQEARVA